MNRQSDDAPVNPNPPSTGATSLLTPVIWCILVTETAERFAYFGFRAILVLYFTIELEFSDSQAIALFAYVTCLAYLSPLAGALLADGYLGRYTTILYFGMLYVVGLAILSSSAWYQGDINIKRGLTFLGLFLVCVGTGGIKPCVSAFGADQVSGSMQSNGNEREAQSALPGYRDNDESSSTHYTHQKEAPIDPRETSTTDDTQTEQVRAFFNYFYFCINVGAVASIAVVPIVRRHLGFGASFSVSCVFMVSAVSLFLSKRREYVRNEPGADGSSLLTTFRLCWWLFRQQIWSYRWVAINFPVWRPAASPFTGSGQHTPVPTSEDNGAASSKGLDNEDEGDIDSNSEIMNQQLDDAAQALHVLPILAMFPIFWALYDQQSSVWTLQATRMALSGLQPEQLNIVNPVEIMAFIPLFDRWIYPAMEARGWNIAPLRRMSWGMVLAAAAFFVSGLVESAIHSREENDLDKLSVFWQLPQITLLALGEIFLSITGLEFAYASSPPRLKAFIMALFLLSTAVGNLFSGTLYSTVFADLNRATVMHICAVLMLGNLGLFCWVSQWWERREFQDLRRTASLQGIEFEERRIV
jgi:dipeptide/tripeptide permease